MENYTITNQNQYFDCAHRLRFLLNQQPQTEGVKEEIQLIQIELDKFEKIRSN